MEDKIIYKVKPPCKLIGEDGNVFNIIGIVCKTLKRQGLQEQAEEFKSRALASKSYYEVLNLVSEYVEIE